MGFLSRLFARKPRYHTSAYGALYSAVASCLRAAGLKVGGTAGYPRIEIHSITEGERLDKDGALRLLSMTVESISDRSMAAAVDMNGTAMEAITTEGAINAGTNWEVLDVSPTMLQDLVESSDSAKILYRVLQTYDVYVLRVKEDDQQPAEQTVTETEIQS